MVNMDEIDDKFYSIEDEFRKFDQQLFSFIRALENCMKDTGKIGPVKDLYTVSEFISKHTENATEIRILEKFLEICDELEGLRKLIKNQLWLEIKENPNIRKSGKPRLIVANLKKWQRLLTPNFDFSTLRIKMPNNQLIRLSCHEANYYFGGVVSLIPNIINMAKYLISKLKDIHYTSFSNPMSAEISRESFSATPSSILSRSPPADSFITRSHTSCSNLTRTSYNSDRSAASQIPSILNSELTASERLPDIQKETASVSNEFRQVNSSQRKASNSIKRQKTSSSFGFDDCETKSTIERKHSAQSTKSRSQRSSVRSLSRPVTSSSKTGYICVMRDAERPFIARGLGSATPKSRFSIVKSSRRPTPFIISGNSSTKRTDISSSHSLSSYIRKLDLESNL